MEVELDMRPDVQTHIVISTKGERPSLWWYNLHLVGMVALLLMLWDKEYVAIVELLLSVASVSARMKILNCWQLLRHQLVMTPPDDKATTHWETGY